MIRKVRLLVVLLAVLLGSGFMNMEGAQAKAPEKGAVAPQFVLKDLKENTVSLRHVYSQNKVTLVNFWATWCPPCRMEIPDLNRLYSKYKHKSVEIIGVNLEKDPEAVAKFVAANQMKFPIVIDPQNQVATKYQVFGIPTTYVLDQNGRIRHVIQGAASYQKLQAVVEEVLKESK